MKFIFTAIGILMMWGSLSTAVAQSNWAESQDFQALTQYIFKERKIDVKANKSSSFVYEDEKLNTRFDYSSNGLGLSLIYIVDLGKDHVNYIIMREEPRFSDNSKSTTTVFSPSGGSKDASPKKHFKLLMAAVRAELDSIE